MEGNAIAIAAKAATISGSHGYRIDGDIAVLSADLAAVDLDAQRARWALQLWACEEPHAGGRVSGTKVAEVGIDLSGTVPGASQCVCAEAPARLPPIGRDYAMVLVLASDAAGRFEQVHDFANFEHRQRFVAPHLEGVVAYAIDGGEVELSAARVFNPRSPGNLSGSLALELRAVRIGPERGGESVVLATVALGRVAGQCAVEQVKARVAFFAPPAGQWQLVLTLVEWTALGFADRDARGFEALYDVAPTAAVEASPDGASVRLAPLSTMAVETLAPTGHRVSIQTASIEDLSRVKGLTQKLAREIVRARPFRSLEELVRVRGIGEKTARKLRDLLTI
ncbi:MAG TPA: helix-hairpin-helix domain-containing protein [Polyangiaceae bacterium]|nr:helix-hairpin-helix domain-containing protein [Polyangiaceae bacterium]